MKSKIVTYFLLSVFVFSTIGIPISLHHCEMMKSVSFQSCGMCDTKPTACCNESYLTSNIKATNDISCCSDKIIASSSNAKYLSESNEIQKPETKSFVFIIPVKQYFTEELFNKTFKSDVSPPINSSNTLYLNNSILLI